MATMEEFYENAEVKDGVLLKYELDDEAHIAIPEGITEIAEDAIEDGYYLESVALPDSLAVLDSSAFSNCCYISEFIVSEDHPHFTFDGTALFNKDKTVLIKVVPTAKGHYDIPDTVVTVGKMAFHECDVTSVTFPPSVKVIEEDAFSCADLTALNLSEGLTEIGPGAFEYCDRLTSLAIPEGVTTIGWGAFSGCDGLVDLTIPGSVIAIGGYAFSHCKDLTAVTIRDGVTTIGMGAFRGCDRLRSVTIANSVTSIGEAAFAECDSLTTITLPEGITTVSKDLFRESKNLSCVHLPDSVTTIGNNAFYMCSALNALELPKNIAVIGDSAFAHTGLCSILLPKGVTTIGSGAFWRCPGLSSLVFPDSVTSIEDSAFEACKNLKSVTIPASVTTIGPWEDFDREKPTVYAPPDSAAWQWAQQNGFPVEKPRAGICPHCGGKLKGLIFKKCADCGKHK